MEMYCPKCGNEQIDEVKFCSKCGAPFQKQESAVDTQEVGGASASAIDAASSRSKMPLVIGFVVALAAIGCLVWFLIPNDEPLYLPTQVMEYTDGELTSVTNYEYENGFISKSWRDSSILESKTTTTYDRDENGLILAANSVTVNDDGENSESKTTYTYELNTKGLPQKATLNTDNSESMTVTEYEYSNGFISKMRRVSDSKSLSGYTHHNEYEGELDAGWTIRSTNSSLSESSGHNTSSEMSSKFHYNYLEGSDLPVSAFRECDSYSYIDNGKESDTNLSDHDAQYIYSYDENGCCVSVVNIFSISNDKKTEMRTEYSDYIKIDQPTPLMLFYAQEKGWYKAAKRVQ